MKTAIELLESAEKKVFCISVCGDKRRNAEYRDMACDLIRQAIDKLKATRWETPEQWKKRTGKAWPEKGAVYYRQKEFGRWDKWFVCGLSFSRPADNTEHQVICATEAGPPPDDWRPEEEHERQI